MILLPAILVLTLLGGTYCEFPEDDYRQMHGCEESGRDPVKHENVSMTTCRFYCRQDPDDVWIYGYFKDNTLCTVLETSKQGYCYRGHCYNYPGGKQVKPQDLEEPPQALPSTTERALPSTKQPGSKKSNKTKKTRKPQKGKKQRKQ
ncbi:uncharacterized protein LOC135378591 [Ornithodoros turicata]|uniref:uncharacterized protein LOC135378591 n=1 Tax=Ornithodoros turicata TaxID=34597 RepID=UPI00313A0FF2